MVVDDLLVRLRRGFGGMVPSICDEAANEIERLRAGRKPGLIAGEDLSAGDLVTIKGGNLVMRAILR